MDIKIGEYLGKHKELKAEQVRKLPAGTRVLRHSFDRYGNHVELELTVVQSGKKKILATRDYYGNRIEKPITKETDKVFYSEV